MRLFVAFNDEAVCTEIVVCTGVALYSCSVDWDFVGTGIAAMKFFGRDGRHSDAFRIWVSNGNEILNKEKASFLRYGELSTERVSIYHSSNIKLLEIRQKR